MLGKNRKLGRAFIVLVEKEVKDAVIGADLRAFWAPGECYVKSFKDDAKKQRLAEKLACRIAGAKNFRTLLRWFDEAGVTDRVHDRAFWEVAERQKVLDLLNRYG